MGRAELILRGLRHKKRFLKISILKIFFSSRSIHFFGREFTGLAIFCSEYRLGAALQPLSGLLVTAAFRVYLQFGWELGADILGAVSTREARVLTPWHSPTRSHAASSARAPPASPARTQQDGEEPTASARSSTTLRPRAATSLGTAPPRLF